MTQAFQSNVLNQLARKSRFLKRERKLDPFMLMLSTISSPGSGKIETLPNSHRSYNFLAREPVTDKPFHNQLSKPAFADFMHHATGYLWETLIRKSLTTPAQLSGALLLANAGYFIRDCVAGLLKAKTDFISKADWEINPVIESCHTPTKYNENLSVVKLKSASPYLSKKQPNELTMRWQNHEGETFLCRLLVTWNFCSPMLSTSVQESAAFTLSPHAYY